MPVQATHGPVSQSVSTVSNSMLLADNEYQLSQSYAALCALRLQYSLYWEPATMKPSSQAEATIEGVVCTTFTTTI